MKTAPAIGAKVRLTRAFLRNTGQFSGHDAHGKWLVIACPCGLCRSGDYVSTNQPDSGGWYNDVPSSERPTGRHFSVANLELVK